MIFQTGQKIGTDGVLIIAHKLGFPNSKRKLILTSSNWQRQLCTKSEKRKTLKQQIAWN